MTLLEYSNSKQVQDTATAYAERHGGSFFWEEPGGGFVYELEEDTFSPPADATVDQVLKDLQGGKLIPDIWTKLEDPARMSSIKPLMKASC